MGTGRSVGPGPCQLATLVQFRVERRIVHSQTMWVTAVGFREDVAATFGFSIGWNSNQFSFSRQLEASWGSKGSDGWHRVDSVGPRRRNYGGLGVEMPGLWRSHPALPDPDTHHIHLIIQNR